MYTAVKHQHSDGKKCKGSKIKNLKKLEGQITPTKSPLNSPTTKIDKVEEAEA